jgi:hypothetical protein
MKSGGEYNDTCGIHAIDFPQVQLKGVQFKVEGGIFWQEDCFV